MDSCFRRNDKQRACLSTPRRPLFPLIEGNGRSPSTHAVPSEYHSPLEGESVRRGRSPRPNRWGDEQARQKSSADAPDKPCKTPRPPVFLQGEKRSPKRRCKADACALHGPCRSGQRSGGHPPPHQPSPHGSASATPPQGGSDCYRTVTHPSFLVELSPACIHPAGAGMTDMKPLSFRGGGGGGGFAGSSSRTRKKEGSQTAALLHSSSCYAGSVSTNQPSTRRMRPGF